MNGEQFLLLYWVILCLLSYLQFYVDKRRAERGEWRIPERTLLITAGLGGAAGAWLAMYRFHHKTRHKVFTFGIPLMFLMHLVIVGILLWT